MENLQSTKDQSIYTYIKFSIFLNQKTKKKIPTFYWSAWSRNIMILDIKPTKERREGKGTMHRSSKEYPLQFAEDHSSRWLPSRRTCQDKGNRWWYPQEPNESSLQQSSEHRVEALYSPAASLLSCFSTTPPFFFVCFSSSAPVLSFPPKNWIAATHSSEAWDWIHAQTHSKNARTSQVVPLFYWWLKIEIKKSNWY